MTERTCGHNAVEADASDALRGADSATLLVVLSADDLLHVTFGTTKFRPGYRTDDVNKLLDEATTTLRDRSAGRPGTITAEQVRARTFRTTQALVGYEIAEVDDFVAELARTLEVAEVAGPGAPPAVVPAERGPGIRRVLETLVIGERPVERHAHSPRAPRVRVRNVTIDRTGITWKTAFRRGFIPVASISRVELVDIVTVGQGSDTVTTYALPLDRAGAALVRVGPGARRSPIITMDHAAEDAATYRKWIRSAWDGLGVPVVRRASALARAKDARRTWPEAFSLARAYVWGPVITLLLAIGLLVALAYGLGNLPA